MIVLQSKEGSRGDFPFAIIIYKKKRVNIKYDTINMTLSQEGASKGNLQNMFI